MGLQGVFRIYLWINLWIMWITHKCFSPERNYFLIYVNQFLSTSVVSDTTSAVTEKYPSFFKNYGMYRKGKIVEICSKIMWTFIDDYVKMYLVKVGFYHDFLLPFIKSAALPHII